ncbi:hypothetical protein I7331_04650, partial [Frankia sp. AgB1.8]|nr:hypothetical protein [Frankia sp. AgB1.8]
EKVHAGARQKAHNEGKGKIFDAAEAPPRAHNPGPRPPHGTAADARPTARFR